METTKKVLDGYNLALEQLNKLSLLGYKITTVRPKSSFDNDMVEKYNTPARLSPELWRHVSIHVDDTHSIDDVFEVQEPLIEKGITFDTGGGGGARDWELDWSFGVK